MIKINREDLIAINDLAQISTATKVGKMQNYIIEINKEEGCIFVEKYHHTGSYAVCLRKDLDNIKKDELIPIADSIKFGEILSQIIDDEEISISTKDNKVLLKTEKDNIELPYYEEEDEEKESRERVKIAFKTRKYGNEDNVLSYYELENSEDAEPDAICKIDMKKLKIKKISDVFGVSSVIIGAKQGIFYINIGEKQTYTIKRTIKKGEKDAMNIEGECEVILQNTDCFSLLAKYDGMTFVDMKENFPLVVKKKLPANRIGLNYLISLMEETK